MSKAYLVLEDGTVFEGNTFGAECDCIGEVVFTVGGMCGYLETLSDPSYYGQIVVQTFPTIGNYGAIEADLESECTLKGYVVREYCDTPSNFRCDGTLGDLLKARGIPAICDIDTRALTVYLRENGTMNGKICREVPKSLDEIKDYKIVGAVKSASTDKTKVYEAVGDEKYRITVIDCGVKKSFVDQLCKMGATVNLVPYHSTVEQIMATMPQGILVSNGGGNPAENVDVIATVRALMGKLPMLGIGLGHQIMALAAGGKVEKMAVGHRGGSQPVRHLDRGICYITNQNHGYAVVDDSVAGARTFMVNLNDGSVEALEYAEDSAFSVQFYPEVYGTFTDGSFVFDRFLDSIRGV